MPAARARASSEGATGPPPSSTQRSPGTRSRPASSSRCRVVATRLTTLIRSLAQRAQRARRARSCSWTHGGGRVDRAAHQDREAAHVGQRHHAQPALLGGGAERHGRAEGAPQQVAVGELDLLRRGAAARGVHHQRGRVEVVTLVHAPSGRRPSARRRAAAGAGGAAAAAPPARRRSRAAPARCSDSERRRSIGTAAAPSSRHACSARAKSSTGGKRDPDAGSRGRRRGPASSAAPARASRVQLRVGEGALGRRERRMLGSRSSGAGEPSVDHHGAQASLRPREHHLDGSAERMSSPTSATRSRPRPTRGSRRSRSPARRSATPSGRRRSSRSPARWRTPARTPRSA